MILVPPANTAIPTDFAGVKGSQNRSFAAQDSTGVPKRGLLHADRFGGAHVDASAAIATRIGVDDGDPILHCNRIEGARINAGFTSGALFRIYDGCHYVSPNKQMLPTNLFYVPITT